MSLSGVLFVLLVAPKSRIWERIAQVASTCAGTISILAAARTYLTIFYDPADEKKRVLAVTKSNLAEPPKNLSYQVVPGESNTPHIQWFGEMNLEVSTLCGPGINLSFPRQEIIKALQSSKRSLDVKEIAEITGLNYRTLRMTLSRMHEAGLIAHPFRGMYTTLEHDAKLKFDGNRVLN